MRSRIAGLLGISPPLDNNDLLTVEELPYVLGVSQRDVLELTRREDFPEPMMNRHSYVANERLPQPRPVWDRADVEGWAKEAMLTQRQGEPDGA